MILRFSTSAHSTSTSCPTCKRRRRQPISSGSPRRPRRLICHFHLPSTHFSSLAEWYTRNRGALTSSIPSSRTTHGVVRSGCASLGGMDPRPGRRFGKQWQVSLNWCWTSWKRKSGLLCKQQWWYRMRCGPCGAMLAPLRPGESNCECPYISHLPIGLHKV